MQASIALVVMFFLVGILSLIVTKAWRCRRHLPGGSAPVADDQHSDKILVLDRMLRDPAIIRALIQTNTLSKEGLRRLVHKLGEMTEDELSYTQSKLFANRMCRIVIAKWIQNETGVPKHESMERMMRLVTGVRAVEKKLRGKQ